MFSCQKHFSKNKLVQNDKKINNITAVSYTHLSGVVRLTAAELDEEAMEKLAQKMQENVWKLTNAKGNQLSGTIDVQEEKMLFFSIPYDKGWNVKIDGKAVKTKALGKADVYKRQVEGILFSYPIRMMSGKKIK